MYLKLIQENKELKEKVLRSLAEEENVRRIAKRDVDNARLYANTSFAKAMLEVADDLNRALPSVPLDKRGESQDPASLSSLIKGIEMTDRNLHKIFTKFGIVKYEAFDPNLRCMKCQTRQKPLGPSLRWLRWAISCRTESYAQLRLALLSTLLEPI